MTKSDKNTVILGAFLMALTIGLGAFGAHGLKALVATTSLETFETGVRYQMYHSLAVVMLGLANMVPRSVKKWPVRLFVLGMILFSGSLYLLTFQNVWEVDLSVVGPITPLGGLLLISGWVLLGIRLLTMNRDNSAR
tara:strand:- start:3345 stop:3755 length:411 start_codon:yes stop_codon:yes gene_type:complete